jgi:protein SCO1/2
MNRRELFTSFARDNPACQQPACQPNHGSSTARFVPNALLRTHEDKQVRFYDDLIKGKQVIISMMYATCEGACPVATAKLVKIYRALEHRMNKDLFIYSITLKPEEDGPAELKHYAQMHGALLPGWTFLTGDPYDIETIRFRLYKMNHLYVDLDLSFHARRLRVINDRYNTWVKINSNLPLESVLKRIAWADPPKSYEELFRENIELQKKIDEDVKRYGYRKTS